MAFQKLAVDLVTGQRLLLAVSAGSLSKLAAATFLLALWLAPSVDDCVPMAG